MPLLEVEDLHIHFGKVAAVSGVSFGLEAGRTLCLVGESGCGKSITALSLAQLLPSPPTVYPRGSIRVENREVLGLSPTELVRLRGRTFGYVFQEPGTSLHPAVRVGDQIREALRLHRPGHADHAEVIRLLRQVGIAAPEVRARDFPHQMSGGMQQRVMIAAALACEPRILIADEPTTALDVTIQAQILELLADLQRQHAMALLLITHNLALVAEKADDVAVMYAGEIVEQGPSAELLARPMHPYTSALLASVPGLDSSVPSARDPAVMAGGPGRRLRGIPGSVPGPGRWPPGCRFAPRCDLARAECHLVHPELVRHGSNRWLRCPVVGSAAPSETRGVATESTHGTA